VDSRRFSKRTSLPFPFRLALLFCSLPLSLSLALTHLHVFSFLAFFRWALLRSSKDASSRRVSSSFLSFSRFVSLLYTPLSDSFPRSSFLASSALGEPLYAFPKPPFPSRRRYSTALFPRPPPPPLLSKNHIISPLIYYIDDHMHVRVW